MQVSIIFYDYDYDRKYIEREQWRRKSTRCWLSIGCRSAKALKGIIFNLYAVWWFLFRLEFFFFIRNKTETLPRCHFKCEHEHSQYEMLSDGKFHRHHCTQCTCYRLLSHPAIGMFESSAQMANMNSHLFHKWSRMTAAHLRTVSFNSRK